MLTGNLLFESQHLSKSEAYVLGTVKKSRTLSLVSNLRRTIFVFIRIDLPSTRRNGIAQIASQTLDVLGRLSSRNTSRQFDVIINALPRRMGNKISVNFTIRQTKFNVLYKILWYCNKDNAGDSTKPAFKEHFKTN